MTVINIEMVQCDNCGKAVEVECVPQNWGCYNWDGSFRKPWDEALDKPSLDLCPECDDVANLERLVWGDTPAIPETPALQPALF